MKGPVKKAVQKLLVSRRHRLYEEQIAKQALPYDVWLKEILEEEADDIFKWNRDAAKPGAPGSTRLSVEVLSWEEFCGYLSPGGHSETASAGTDFTTLGPDGANAVTRSLPDLWIVTPMPDCLVQGATLEVARFFQEHPACEIAYGDEEGYFKPDWSPDLLQSFFYFGNVFAVRQSLIEKISGICKRTTAPKVSHHTFAGEQEMSVQKKPEENPELSLKKRLYEIVLCCIDEAGEAGHIEKILFLPGSRHKMSTLPESETAKDRAEHSGSEPETSTNTRTPGCPGTDWGMEPEYAELKKGHLYSDVEIPAQKAEQDLVSVIIPSKDNPHVLSTCIHSLLQKTTYRNLEILVVDNGSKEENKQEILKLQQQIQQLLLQQGEETLSFQYIYRPMAFNFSAMCNLGAEKASGKYLLFLNDDIEIVRPDWLSILISKGAKDYVGAVGTKLLYPDSDKIQHMGVTNIHLGPAHKLQFSSDREIYYHGINRCAVNVSAVTGACLLIRKTVFEEIGGFEEKLQVAFNDVELCFHLLQAGYKNVCCNQTWLYHHESLSRGSDDGEEKVARLHRERDFLYAAYPEMWNRDAYYSRRLVSDVLDRGFHPACRFQEGRMSTKAVPVPFKGQLRPQWHNKTLFMGLEFTGDETAWRTGKPGGGDYYIQGWSYVLHEDNSRYQKSLLLKLGDQLWKIPYQGCYRPDFQEGMTHIDHPALSGVSVWIPRQALPAGEYLIGYFWEDTCSRQKLYGFSAEKIQIQ